MPHSLILNLLPLAPISPEYLSGRHLHALFLALVSSCDRNLGDTLHNSQADKAFTLSPLQVLGNKKKTDQLQFQYHRPIPAGTSCWWRISLLDDRLFGRLTQLWLNLNPDRPWHLGSADLKITSIFGTPQSTQPWANACTYAQLYEQASKDRTLPFIFATPTAFRQGKHDTALPTPESVFNSLLKRWNRYSGIEIDPFPQNSVFPSYFDLHTEVATDSRSKFIGCTGEVSYRLLGSIEPMQIKQMNALADFALYCGVGRKTTMGMGMVRRKISCE